MRFLKWFAIGCVLLVVLSSAGLYLARYRPGAATVAESVDILAPPEAVWELVGSAERSRQWIPDMLEVKNLTPGVDGVGGRTHIVMNMGGDRSELEFTTVAFEKPKRIEMDERSLTKPEVAFRARITYTLEPIPGGTRVTQHSKTEYHTELGRLLEPIITRTAAGLSRSYLANLKRVCEAKK